jgi:hypothetical protein
MDASEATTDSVSAQAKQPNGSGGLAARGRLDCGRNNRQEYPCDDLALIVPAGPPAASPSRIFSYPASLDLLAVGLSHEDVTLA